MGILTDAVQELAAKSGPLCTVQSLRQTLGDDDRAELDGLLANPAIYSTTLSVAINKTLEAKVSPQSLTRHRKRVCACQH